MEFDLNEEQRLLADSVARFVEGRYSPEQRRRWLAEPRGFSAGNWRAMVDLGLNALPFAEADGGLGGDRLTRSVLAEALGAGPVTEPYLACIVMAGGLLAELGSRTQKDAWLAPLIDGSRVLCLAHAERASRDRVDRVRTSARRDGDGYRLDGEKTFVLAGGGADAAIVLARTAGEHDDRDGLSLFVVALDAPGVTRTPYRLVDGSLAAEIRFDAVHVADDALLGKAGGAWPAVRQTMVDTALAVCAESVGAMQRLLDMTLDYVRTREQFGGPIGRFQALQHRLVDAYLALEQARSLTMRVVRAADAAGGTDDAVAAAAFGARALVAEAARHVGHEAIQMHGGMGMTDELAVSHFHRRLLLLEAIFGDPSAHLDHTGTWFACTASIRCPHSRSRPTWPFVTRSAPSSGPSSTTRCARPRPYTERVRGEGRDDPLATAAPCARLGRLPVAGKPVAPAGRRCGATSSRRSWRRPRPHAWRRWD
ncbi:MAG: acyl-CoA dehydrogenase [Burkholderiaceae bacterium]